MARPKLGRNPSHIYLHLINHTAMIYTTIHVYVYPLLCSCIHDTALVYTTIYVMYIQYCIPVSIILHWHARLYTFMYIHYCVPVSMIPLWYIRLYIFMYINCCTLVSMIPRWYTRLYMFMHMHYCVPVSMIPQWGMHGYISLCVCITVYIVYVNAFPHNGLTKCNYANKKDSHIFVDAIFFY